MIRFHERPLLILSAVRRFFNKNTPSYFFAKAEKHWNDPDRRVLLGQILIIEKFRTFSRHKTTDDVTSNHYTLIYLELFINMGTT